jgi:hypothetical protein
MLARLTGLSIVLLLPVSAATIYSNFSAGDTFNPNSGFLIGEFGGTVFAEAQEFSPSGNSYTLDEVQLVMNAPFAPVDNELTITVSSSDINGLPGTVLESFDVLNALGMNVIITADSSIHPLLLDGVNYWLTAAFTNPSSSSDEVFWNSSVNSSAVFSDTAFQLNGGAWQAESTTNMGAFEIDGTIAQVPEAATVTLVGFGLAALGLCGARRKKRWRSVAF